jgi:hypothetical protein
MKLLIPGIAKTTTRSDIRDFVNRGFVKWFRLPFTPQPKIVSCKIISNTNSIGVIQRHGIINVLPDDVAAKIIRRLNGEYLSGKRVGVKQYSDTPE